MSLKSLPWTRPLRAPFEEVFLSLLDGTVYRWKPLSHRQAATRLVIPANYTSNKLICWNQQKELVYLGAKKIYGNPWFIEKRSGSGDPYYRIAAIAINTGASIKLKELNGTSTIGDFASGTVETGCNWTHDKANNKYSFEFYVDNDLEETDPIVIYDDDEGFWDVWQTGSGSYGITVSEETTEVIKGSSSTKMVIGAGAYANLGIDHWFVGNQDWSAKGFKGVLIYGANTGIEIRVRLRDNDGNSQYWVLIDNFSGWKRVVLPLNNPDVEAGTFDLSIIDRMSIFYQGIDQTFTSYLDRTVVDVGQWGKVEAYVPDTLFSSPVSLNLLSWDGSAWAVSGTLGFLYGHNNIERWNYINTTRLYFLDGSTANVIYDGQNNGVAGFYHGLRGETKGRGTGDAGAGGITYSSYYGVKKRIGFAIKMPPDDGQDASDAGTSQCKLKLEVYYDDNGKATFEFKNDNDPYYGLTNMNDSWLAVFDETTKKVELLILSKRPAGLEVRADENELIDRVDLTLVKGTRVFVGKLVHGDLTRDTDSDDVPDFLEDFIAPLVSKMFVKGGFP
jgi:hypothetical protein